MPTVRVNNQAVYAAIERCALGTRARYRSKKFTRPGGSWVPDLYHQVGAQATAPYSLHYFRCKRINTEKSTTEDKVDEVDESSTTRKSNTRRIQKPGMLFNTLRAIPASAVHEYTSTHKRGKRETGALNDSLLRTLTCSSRLPPTTTFPPQFNLPGTFFSVSYHAYGLLPRHMGNQIDKGCAPRLFPPSRHFIRRAPHTSLPQNPFSYTLAANRRTESDSP